MELGLKKVPMWVEGMWQSGGHGVYWKWVQTWVRTSGLCDLGEFPFLFQSCL